MTSILKRTTLIVRDMEKSIEFYRDVLGMTKYYDNQITLGGDLLPAGNEGDVTHLTMWKCEDPVIGMIGLLEWIDPVWEAPEITYKVGYGNPVFVAGIEDAEEVYEKAKKMGCVIRAPLSEAEYPAAAGGIVRVRSVGVFDPDGHFFELNQTL
jgi:catechol 2,3-dioxygenase-like lactoylglutathione lyase family enzyme